MVNEYRAAEDAWWNAHAIERADRMVDVNGTPVRVQETGAGDTVVFIHGSPNAGATWAPLVASLQGRRCVMLDRPGCGLSPAPAGVREIKREALATLDAVIGERQVDLVGSSFGGTWALWWALARPERVRRIVLLGMPALCPGQTIGFGSRLFVSGWGFRHLMAALPPSPGAVRMIMKTIGHAAALADGRIGAPFLDWYLALTKLTETNRHETAIRPQILPVLGTNASAAIDAAALGALAAPVHVVFGDAEPQGDLAALLPGFRAATSEVIAKSGHLPWLDEPRVCARSVDAFLA